VVLDNVTSAEQLTGLLPQGSAGRVLVTSRDRSLRQFGTLLTVDVFDEDTAAFPDDVALRSTWDACEQMLAHVQTLAVTCPIPKSMRPSCSLCLTTPACISFMPSPAC
jgi:hypothetical protein